tara:strand:+ start:356 stop:625 length:270 start_codon:yes stop_codon:yes gene_type:complete
VLDSRQAFAAEAWKRGSIPWRETMIVLGTTITELLGNILMKLLRIDKGDERVKAAYKEYLVHKMKMKGAAEEEEGVFNLLESLAKAHAM